MPDKFKRLAEVEETTGLRKSAIYKLISEGKFPRPYKLTARAVAWRESEVEEWIESREVT